MIRGRAEVRVLNIDTNPEWTEKYGLRIPVVELNGKDLCQYHLDAEAIRSALVEAEDLSRDA